MKNHNDINHLIANYRTLTPVEWALLKDRVARRAKAERGRAVRGAFLATFQWLSTGVTRMWKEVLVFGHPSFPSRGTCRR